MILSHCGFKWKKELRKLSKKGSVPEEKLQLTCLMVKQIRTKSIIPDYRLSR